MAAVQEDVRFVSDAWARAIQEKDQNGRELLRCVVGMCAIAITACIVIVSYTFCRHAIKKTANDTRIAVATEGIVEAIRTK